MCRVQLRRVVACALISSSALAARADPWGCDALPPSAFATHTLRSPDGRLELDFLAYGGTAQRLRVRAHRDAAVDVLLGFDDATQYCRGTFGQAGHPYFGALIGRVANRISGGAFPFAGCAGGECHTPVNELPGNDTLHGGTFGYDRRVWAVTPLNGSAAQLDYTSPAGEMGFPGELAVSVTYVLTEEPAWRILYAAHTTDGSDTVFAPTQHAYWNLNGARDLVLEHELSMPAGAHFVEVDQFLLPTGAIGAVRDRDADFLDFTRGKPVGRDINRTTVYSWGTGYDNAWIFDGWVPGGREQEQLTVVSPLSGIGMTFSTDQPSVQVYSGNFLNGTIPQKASQNPQAFYEHWGALAIEAQHFPDASSHPSFPPITLKSGEVYRQRTSYRFFGEGLADHDDD